MVEGTLKFSETEGKFYITNEQTEDVLGSIEFNDTFQAFENGNWIDTTLQIGSADNGELIFKLKDTGYAGNLDGVTVRK